MPSGAALLHAWPPRSALSVPSGADVVVARGAAPPIGSVRPRIDPVKRDTFPPARIAGPVHPAHQPDVDHLLAPPHRPGKRSSDRFDAQGPPEWLIVGAGALSRLRSSHGPLPSHRRTRPGGRSADCRARLVAGCRGLVRRSPVRLAQHLRRPARPRRRWVHAAGPRASRRGLQAALLPRHGHSGDAVHVTGRGGRGGRLHAAGPDPHRHRPSHPDTRRADRAGDRRLHARVPPALRLRPGRAPAGARREHGCFPVPGDGRAPAGLLPAGAGRPGRTRQGDAERRRVGRRRVHRLRVRRRGTRTPHGRRAHRTGL